jgi:hypothetical protein
MTAKHISDARQRKTKKYRDLHARLAHEVAEEAVSRALVEKHNRSVRASAEYRQNGGA